MMTSVRTTRMARATTATTATRPPARSDVESLLSTSSVPPIGPGPPLRPESTLDTPRRGGVKCPWLEDPCVQLARLRSLRGSHAGIRDRGSPAMIAPVSLRWATGTAATSAPRSAATFTGECETSMVIVPNSSGCRSSSSPSPGVTHPWHVQLYTGPPPPRSPWHTPEAWCSAFGAGWRWERVRATNAI